MAGYWDCCFYKKNILPPGWKANKNGLMNRREPKQIYFSSKANLGKATINETQ